ncbi:MAG: neutral zinc metallopeptidase [Patulibacter minatonensis]
MRTRRTDDAGDMIDARGSGGGLGRAGKGAGGLGLTGVLILLAIQLLSGGEVSIPAGFDPSAAIANGSAPVRSSKEEDSLAQFSGRVAADIQDVWTDLFRQDGSTYTRAKIVRYSGAVNTACGDATSAVGPFYCPGDQRVYLDMSFYADMRDELGATGDFAWAYVISHELGHHVQELTGTFDEVQKAERDDPQAGEGAQGLSVRTELQADCYAGVWAHAAYGYGQLDAGDLQEAFGAAQAVGDDRLQGAGGGTVRPDTFTHGTSRQRQHWFEVGYESGRPGSCDTFAPDRI